MDDQPMDWLDQRLADQTYTPDDGFTARVTAVLPNIQPKKAAHLRPIILGVFGFLALCLAAIHISQVIAQLTQIDPRNLQDAALGRLAFYVHQPLLLYGGASLVIILGIAAIPLLRRWA